MSENISFDDCSDSVKSGISSLIQLVNKRYSNLAGVQPYLRYGPSQRALLERLEVLKSAVRPSNSVDLGLYNVAAGNLPNEYQVVFERLADDELLYDETLVVFLSEEGEILEFCHSS